MPYINNVELVSRYDRENDDGLTAGGAAATKTDRYTAGCVYYFSNTLLFEADYEWLREPRPRRPCLPTGLFSNSLTGSK